VRPIEQPEERTGRPQRLANRTSTAPRNRACATALGPMYSI
ncbi:MAG: hypothetical protein AVDCRST_MAG75-86, partial [uncultured Propionibacteriaceae bacterium]